MKWKLLESVEEFNKLISSSTSFAIFKHSTTCPISAAAKKRLELGWDKENNEVDIFYLDLLAHRDISNLIADSLKVVHQSPQFLVIKNGEVVYHASHISISSSKAAKALKK